MSDIPQPSEVLPSNETGNELVKKFTEASRIGRIALKVADERFNSRYSLPYLNPGLFPKEQVRNVMGKENPTEEDVQNARRGSVALAVESVFQIREAAPPRTPGVNEELSSVENLLTFVKQSHGFTIQAEAMDPQVVIIATKEALARRQRVKPEQIQKTDQELKNLANENFTRAGRRLTEKVQAVKNYLGHRL